MSYKKPHKNAHADMGNGDGGLLWLPVCPPVSLVFEGNIHAHGTIGAGSDRTELSLRRYLYLTHDREAFVETTGGRSSGDL
jgi:hypothetical protein